MSNSIRISKKYGVNATVCKCFFCGESKGVALLGQIGDARKGEDIEAPRELIIDYEPCDKCMEVMKNGVTLIEVSDQQPTDKRPALTAQGNQKVYPLGGWCVIKPESFSDMTNTSWTAGQKCFVDSEVFKMVTGGAKQCQ